MNISITDFTITIFSNYSDNIKEKTKNFPFAPENKISPQDKFSDYMNEIKPDTYTPYKKLICDWTDKKII